MTTSWPDIVHIGLMVDDARLLLGTLTPQLDKAGLSIEQRSVLLSVSIQLLQGLRGTLDEQLAAR